MFDFMQGTVDLYFANQTSFVNLFVQRGEERRQNITGQINSFHRDVDSLDLNALDEKIENGFEALLIPSTILQRLQTFILNTPTQIQALDKNARAAGTEAINCCRWD